MFLAIGAGLFALNEFVNDDVSAETSQNQIRVEQGNYNMLNATFKKQWNRSPTEAELNSLVENYIRDEIFFREAKILGLDKGDTVIRRRLAQKMEFLVGDIGTSIEPTLEELNEFYQENSEKYQTSGNISFVHVFLNPDRHSGSMPQAIEALQESLTDITPQESLSMELGDSIMLPYVFEDTPMDQVDRMFGSGFSENLKPVDLLKWQGPIQSGFGMHFVFIIDRTENSLPPLDTVITDVRQDLQYQKRKKFEDDAYQQVKERYEIISEYSPNIE